MGREEGWSGVKRWGRSGEELWDGEVDRSREVGRGGVER